MNNIDPKKAPLRDRLLLCVDCGIRFTFTAGEQRYFLSKSLSEPKRCPMCRHRRKLTLVPEGGPHG